jgi:hypothetical protein
MAVSAISSQLAAIAQERNLLALKLAAEQEQAVVQLVLEASRQTQSLASAPARLVDVKV